MAALTGLFIADSYKALLKTVDNDVLGAAAKEIVDGYGNVSGVLFDTSGNVTINGNFRALDAILDSSGSAGTAGQVLTTTGSTTQWQSLSSVSGVTGSGTAGYLPLWSTNSALTNSIALQFGSTITISGTLTATTKINTPTLQLTGGTGAQGTLSWNADEETVDLIQNGATLQLGQEIQIHCKNQTGALIPDGTPVYAAGTLGASGRIKIAPMIANGSIQAKYFLGVTTEDIADGDDGKVTTFGKIRGLNTAAYTEGQTLWVSSTTAGAFQTTRPLAPNLDLEVAIVINSHANNGTIFVRANNGHYLGTAHDVNISSVAENDLLVYKTNRWVNTKSIGDLSAANLTLTGYLRGPEVFVIDPAAFGNNTGLVQILGDLRVDGITTTINSTTISVSDKNITLAKDAVTAGDANGAGITIAGANATLTYLSASDDFTFNKNVNASRFFGPLTGNVTGTVSTLSNHDTDDLDEGLTNLYFTTARARDSFSAGTGVAINAGEISIGQSVGTTDNVTFGIVTASLSGNASTASALAAAVNIALDGSVTGNADFDGSGNITITTTTNHNHDDRYYTETESDGKYLLNTTDTLDGNLTVTGDLIVTGGIDLSNADLDIGSADIIFGTTAGGATRGLIWDVSGSGFLSKLIGGGADGGKVTLFANMDDAITTGNIFEIKDGSTGSLFLGLSHAGILTAGGGTSTQWNTAYTLLNSGTSSFYGLLYSSLDGDLNTYNLPGLYSAEYTGNTNRPLADNGHFIQISDAGGNDVKTQFYYASAGERLFTRLQWGAGTWRNWRELIHDGNIGSQSVSYATTAGNAALLDSIDSSQFLRSDESDTMNGNLDITGRIKFGGYSYIGEDLSDTDSLTIACDSSESIHFAQYTIATETYSTKMVLNPSGYLGINISNPADYLHISGPNDFSRGIRFSESDGDYLSKITFSSEGPSNSNWGLNFYTPNAETTQVLNMALRGNGRVGINIADPSETLHVAGNLRVDANITAGDSKFYNSVQLTDSLGGTTQGWMWTSSANELNFGIGNVGAERIKFSILSDGNSRIYGAQQLQFFNSNVHINSHDGNDLNLTAFDDINLYSRYIRMFNGTTEYARISDNSGNWINIPSTVGMGMAIGHTTAEAMLDVRRTHLYTGHALIAANTNKAINMGTYDTAIIQADDVTTLRIVERNSGTDDQVMTLSIGDGNGRISTTAQPLQFFTNGGPTGLGYTGLSGSLVLALETNQRAYFTNNLGIGSSANSARLSVYGAANEWTSDIYASGTTGQSLGVVVRGGTNADDYNFYALDASSNTPFFAIKGNGNIGIGTTSPYANLDLGASGENNIILRNTANAYNLGYIGNAGGRISIGFSDSNGSLVALPYLSVLSSGNVGIGTTSPGYKLDVDVTTDADWAARIKNKSTTGYGLFVEGSENNSEYILGLHNGLAYKMVVTGAGNVGIGTTSPDSLPYGGGGKFAVSQSGSSSFWINGNEMSFDGQGAYRDLNFYFRYSSSATFQTDSYFRFVQNATGQVMTIASNGYVGIGATSMSSKLTIYDSSNTTAGQQIRLGLSGSFDYTMGRNPNTGYLDFNGYNTAGSVYLGAHFQVPIKGGQRGNQNIVRDGLTLYLDFNDRACVGNEGSSTPGVTSLASVNYQIDYSGGANFERKDGIGTMFFDNNADYLIVRNFFATTSNTYELWINSTAWGVGTVWDTIWDSGTERPLLGFYNGQPIFYPDGAVGSALSTNKWYQVVFAVNNDDDYDVYVNGYKIADGLNYSSNQRTGVFDAWIGGDGGLESFYGHIGIVRHYNRQLTPTEVLINYNADVQRFANVTPELGTYIKNGILYAGSNIEASNLNLKLNGNINKTGSGSTLKIINSNAITEMFVNGSGNLGIGIQNNTALAKVHVGGTFTGGYTSDASVGPMLVHNSSTDISTFGIKVKLDATTFGAAMAFWQGSTLRGYIGLSSGGTSYSTSSDYRLKENVVTLDNATEKVMQLKPKRFNFIDGDGVVVDGFLAHEVQEVIPVAVQGEKDGVDHQGNPIYQGIDHSKLVPLLTASLQEALKRIEILEEKINNLNK